MHATMLTEFIPILKREKKVDAGKGLYQNAKYNLRFFMRFMTLSTRFRRSSFCTLSTSFLSSSFAFASRSCFRQNQTNELLS